MSKKMMTDTRRTEIVAALLPVLAKHGYEKATIQLIARQAKLTPGLIHYHFQSKRDILVALTHSLAEYGRERYVRAAASASSADARLQAYINAHLAYGEGASPVVVAALVVIGAEAVRQPEVREVYEHMIAAELATAQQLIAECLRTRQRAQKNAQMLAAALLALIAGAFQLASAASAVMPTAYAAPGAFVLMMRALDHEPDDGQTAAQNEEMR